MSSGRITLEDALAACDNAGISREPVTASEVAAELDCTRRAALNKLDELADRGDIESKTVGARSRVWWRPPDRPSASERDETDDAVETANAAETDDAAETRSATADGSVAAIDAPLDAELQAMFGRISDGFYALDDQWQFTYVSERAEELTDVRGKNLLGKNIWDVFDDVIDTELGEEYRTAMETQEPTSFEFYDELLDAWYDIHAYPSETGLSVYFQDISDRKRRERRLEESEHRYRTLVEHFPNGAVALVDDDLNYRTVGGNPLDNTVEELEGSPMRETLSPELVDAIVPRYEAAFEGESSEFETEYEGRVYKVRIVPIRDDDGDTFAALGMSQDVTGRKESQRELEESERRYRTLVEHFPNGSVGLFDEDLRYTAVGGQLVDALDLSPEERIGRSVSELHSDDFLAEVEPYFRAALEGEANSFEVEYRDRRLSAYTVPVRNADEEVYAGMLVVQDVTERREAQRELRESEAKFRMLAENLDEIVWMATAGVGEWLYLNPAFEDVWGLDREELYDEPISFLEAIHPDDRERVREAFAALPETEFDEEYRIVRPDGEVRWVHAQGTEVYGEDGETARLVGIGEDVTERKERERELERALDLLDRTQRIADVGGWEIDADTEDVFWTDQTFELLEVPGDEEPPLDEALDMYHEEDKPIVVSAVEDALASGEPFDVEVRLRTAASDEVRWLRLQGVPETVDGEVVSFRGAAQDVTEKVERERDLEERNERLDSFASLLAHELRNPVTIGQIYSQSLPDEADSEAVAYVSEAFDRIEDMIDVLLVLTRGREAIGERTPVQLGDTARDAWENVEPLDATLEVESDRTIQADETYVQHLFRNLFDNAVEHGSTDVTVSVGELPTGFYVADDGAGIPPEERDAVFEAGYTTAAEQGGTGLGLAFVRKLADVYEWECTVTESESGGARFEFANVDGAA